MAAVPLSPAKSTLHSDSMTATDARVDSPSRRLLRQNETASGVSVPGTSSVVAIFPAFPSFRR